MNWDRIEGNWKQFTGKVKEKWGKLTDDDLTAIAGKREQLEGKIQERYGVEKEVADQAHRWCGVRDARAADLRGDELAHFIGVLSMDRPGGLERHERH